MRCLALCLTLCACGSLPSQEIAEGSPWATLLDGTGLGAFRPTEFGGQGEVLLIGTGVRLERGSPLTGLTYQGPFPKVDYELEVTATRESGSDFFLGLTFPVQDSAATLVLGGWGGALTGLSCIDGEDASSNSTKSFIGFQLGQTYRVRLRVLKSDVSAWLDDELLFTLDPTQVQLSIRPEVELSLPLGVASYVTQARIENLRYRSLSEAHPK